MNRVPGQDRYQQWHEVKMGSSKWKNIRHHGRDNLQTMESTAVGKKDAVQGRIRPAHEFHETAYC
jgi:hypothetical protein